MNRSRLLPLVVLALAAAFALGACAEDNTALPPIHNSPPTLLPLQVSTDEDVPVELAVLGGASDPDGDPLTVVSADAEGHLAEIVGPANVKVTPKPNFYGVIHVNYTVSDGHGNLAVGSATVTVRSLNDAPVALGGTQDVRGKSTIFLQASDVDGDTLTYEITAGPTHGTLSGNAPQLQYVPDLGFTGDDAITFRVSDGKLASAPATIQLHVAPGGPPTAFDAQSFAFEDEQAELFLGGSDPDGHPLTFTVVMPPAHGTLSGTAPDLFYTPAPDFNGSDSLQFSVSDGFQSSAVARVTITVLPLNDPPVAIPQTVAATEDVASNIVLKGTDVDGDALTFELLTFPAHGSLSFTAGSGDHTGATWTYTPAPNYHGPDSFRFNAVDPLSQRSSATVTIDVAPVNDPPVAAPFSVSLAEDASAAVTLRGSDVDGDPLTYTIVTPPSHGTLSGTAPALRYTPALNYNGPDSFTYTTSDSQLTSPSATVTLQVTPVNDPPVAVDGSVTTVEDTPVAITLQASDIDSSTLTFTIATPPSDGTLTGSGTSWTYTPARNATGTRSFTFRVSDGSLTATGKVTIQITPVNDPPTPVDDFVATDAGTPLLIDVLGNDMAADVDGDTLQIDSVDAPAHGTIEIVAGKLRYTPDAGFTGIEVFGYTVIDPQGVTGRAHAHVGVATFPPDAPTEAIATAGGAVTVDDASRAPAISADGRYIAFTSALALVSDDTNGVEDVYLYDRGTRTITRVSVATDGTQGNAASFRPHLSADGRYTVFDSVASNLVTGDTNGAADVFRHDRVTGETIRVSVAGDGGQASGASFDAVVSEDGNLVVFGSVAFDLVPFGIDTNGAQDVFIRDVTAGTTERISVSNTGGEADLLSGEPAISGDGRFVAFTSQATNLVAGDTNNLFDVFLRDRVAGTTTRVSVSSTGGEASGRCFGPSLSRDGRFISFLSDATDLVAGAPAPVQLYVRDAQGGITTRPVSSSTAIVRARLSGAGRYATAFSSAGTLLRDRFAAVTATLPSASSHWFWPTISGNGRYVVVLDSSNGSVTVTPNPL